jgi:hypothetical protein
MAGPEVSWGSMRDQRKRSRSRRERERPQWPRVCWRCGKAEPVIGHASCQQCLEYIERRARAIRRRYAAEEKASD